LRNGPTLQTGCFPPNQQKVNVWYGGTEHHLAAAAAAAAGGGGGGVREASMAQLPPTRQYPRWTLGVVCIATLMLLLDVTVVAVALSNIQADFHSDLGSLQWVVDAYTLPLAGLLLTAATLGDRIGRRRVFLVGMALFTLGSLACALAWSPLVLDLTRAVQGSAARCCSASGFRCSRPHSPNRGPWRRPLVPSAPPWPPRRRSVRWSAVRWWTDRAGGGFS
jgi:hypothetical protein